MRDLISPTQLYVRPASHGMVVYEKKTVMQRLYLRVVTRPKLIHSPRGSQTLYLHLINQS